MTTKIPSGVYVRAQVGSTKKWETVDALDLDDESFRRFVLSLMQRHRVAGGVTEEAEASAEQYRTREPERHVAEAVQEIRDRSVSCMTCLDDPRGALEDHDGRAGYGKCPSCGGGR